MNRMNLSIATGDNAGSWPDSPAGAASLDSPTRARRRNVHQVHDFLTSFKGRAGRSMSRKDRRAAPQEEQYVEQEGFYDEMGNWYPADAFEQHFPPQPAAPQLTAVGRLAGFVGLNIGKLEQRLLAEQRRAMELEQEMLMLQWAAPTRGAAGGSTPGSLSPRAALAVTPGVQQPGQLSTMPSSTSIGGPHPAAGGSLNAAPSMLSLPSIRRMSSVGREGGGGGGGHGGGSASRHGSRRYTNHESKRRSMWGAEDHHSELHHHESGSDADLHAHGSKRHVDHFHQQDEEEEEEEQAADLPPPTPPRVSPQPEIINSSSTRFVELFTARQAELAAARQAAAEAEEKAKAEAAAQAAREAWEQQQAAAILKGGGAAYHRSSVLSWGSEPPDHSLSGHDGGHGKPGSPQRVRSPPKELHGTALAHQALGMLERAERLLNKLKEGLPLSDSRPGTGQEQAGAALGLVEAQLNQLKAAHNDVTNAMQRSSLTQVPGSGRPSLSNVVPGAEGHPSPPQLARSSTRKAHVWAKSLAENSMLKSIASNRVGRGSIRRGSKATKSLALTFVDALSHVNTELSLVDGARRRLKAIEDLQRSASLAQAHELTPEALERMHQKGLRMAQRILHDLEGARVAANEAAAASGGKTISAEPSMASIRQGDLGGSTGGRVPEEGEEEDEEELTDQERIYGKGIWGVVNNIVVPAVPRTPEGAVYSGAYGRIADFKKRLRHERAALIQHNPTAFQEDIAEQAEAQYRAMAERARMRHEVVKGKLTEARVQSDFMRAVKYLQSERPFFLPPVVGREKISRPHIQVKAKAIPDFIIEDSVFEPRRKENEARDFYDTDKVKTTQFMLDWQRIASKARFRKTLLRALMNNPSFSSEGGNGETPVLDEELAKIRTELSKYREHLRSIFTYYGCLSYKMNSEDMMTITLNTWLQFCNEAGLVDVTQKGCSGVDLQNIFVLTNYEEEKESQESEANDDDAMMRFEFVEGVIRAAFSKFLDTGYMDEASDAVVMYMEDIILPRVPAEAIVDPNEFRRSRLYTRETAEVVSAHLQMLQAMHKVYKAKDRTKYFWIEHWSTLLESARLLGPVTGLEKRDAKLIFCWSQVLVTDELRRRKRAVGLMFWDFVEAICRVADVVSFHDEEWLNTYFSKEHGVDPKRLASRLAQEQSGSGAGSLPGGGASANTSASGAPGAAGRRGRTGDSGSGANPSSSGVAGGSAGASGSGVPPAGDTQGRGTQGGQQGGTSMSDADLYCLKLNEFFRVTGKEVGRWRRKSCGVIGLPTRPLHVKLELLMRYIVTQMRDQWGGANEADCARKMMRMATMISGGIEMA